MGDLVERLRAPDWHDPACPFAKHCYCGNDGEVPPHDRVMHPLAEEAATALERQAELLAEAREALRAILDAPMIDHQDSSRSAYGIARATLGRMG